jgi:hypothetical protein
MRHVLTLKEQIRGLAKAIDSPRTPPHLRKFLVKRRDELAAELDRRRERARRVVAGRLTHRKQSPGLLDWLGL